MPDDITPSDAPPVDGGQSWFQRNRALAIGGGIVAIGALFLYLRSKSQQSSSGSGGSLGTSTGPAVYEIAPGYLQGNGTSNGGYGQLTGLEQALAGIAAANNAGGTGSTVTGTGASSSAASTAGSVNANASTGPTNVYPVGTQVTSQENIVQSLYDPLYNGWLNLTSEGGIYGSGLNVSGSEFTPGATNPGTLQLASGGKQVSIIGGPQGNRTFAVK